MAKKHPNSHLIQLTAALIFYLIWALDSFIFMFSVVLLNFIPFLLRIIIFSSLQIVGGFLIFRAGQFLFHGENAGSQLRKTGIFAYIRHPLYLGVLIIYLGFIILTVSLISLFGFVIAFILYNRIAIFEESDLERVFKEEYLEYKKKVPKWFPRF